MAENFPPSDEIPRPSGLLDYQDLLRLAHEKSDENRAALFEAISDLATNGEQLLTPTDRSLMKDIVSNLIQNVELSVRQALAERLAEMPDAPRELVSCLANDDIAVARPLLLKSTLLRDPELVEIIQFRTMEHQVAIAMRPTLSENVSDALVGTDNPEVITKLLENQGSRISDDTLARLAEKSMETTCYQSALLQRNELPPRLARKLYWTVSAALREYIVQNFDIDGDVLDDTIESAIEDTIHNGADALANQNGGEQAGPVDSLNDPASTESRERLMALLRRGQISEFVGLFSAMTGLRKTLLQRILFEPGGEGVAVVCRATGIDKSDFALIFLRFQQGRLGDKQVETDELRNSLVNFDRITIEAARKVVARWTRSPEYLNALRMVDNAQE